MGALASVCDIHSDHLQTATDAYPAARSYCQSEVLIRSGDVDAVAIATPPGTHHEIAASALAAGLHVFVEKPMTTDLAAARALVAQAEASRLLLMTGHVLRYHPAFQLLVEIVRNGQLGELRGIVSNRCAASPDIPREHVLWAFAPHDIAMTLACVDALPSSVFCFRPDPESNVPSAECARIELEFPSGLRTRTTVSWRDQTMARRFEVRGELGSALFDDLEPSGSKLMLAMLDEPPNAVGVPEQEPLAVECAAFVEAVATGVAPPNGASEGLGVMLVLDACLRSLEEERTVTLRHTEDCQ